MTRTLKRLALPAIALILFAASCQGRLETVPPTLVPTREPIRQAGRPTQITPTVTLPAETPTEQPAAPTDLPADTPELPRPSATSTTAPTATPLATATPYPTYTPPPTYTPLPTYTAVPSATPLPSATPYPTYTPPPTLTLAPSDTPVPTATPTATETPGPTSTAIFVVTSTPNQTATQRFEAALEAALAGTLAAQPTSTLSPSDTPVPTATPTATETPGPTSTAIFVVTSTPNQTATQRFEAALEAALAGTLAAQPTSTPVPSATPYPTYTPPPTLTLAPSDTPVPTATPTATETPGPTSTAIFVVTSTPNQTATQRFEAALEAALAGTLAAQPTSTPAPSATPYPTYTPPPTYTPLPTFTVAPTDTPAPTATLSATVAPSATATRRPTETPTREVTPTMDVAATTAFEEAVQAAVESTLTALPSPTPQATATLRASATPEPTQALALPDATATERPAEETTPIAVLTVTPTAADEETTPIAVLSVTPRPSPARAVTATATAEERAAVTEAPEDGEAFPVPEGWEPPVEVGPNTMHLTDGTARVLVYYGDPAYFEATWNIPADTRDLDAALEALRTEAGFEQAPLLDESLAGRAEVFVRDVPPEREALYLLRVDDEWLLVSASAPVDEFDAYRADVFEPLIAALLADGFALPSPPMPTASSTALPPTAIDTPAPVTASPTRAPRTATATRAAVTVTPIPLEQVESELLGLAFEAPGQWTRWTDSDSPETERVEFFFEDRADAGSADTVPEHPAIAVLAITEVEVADAGEYDTPEEVLRGAMLLDAEAITSFDHPLFPAARGVDDEVQPGVSAVLYALQPEEGAWIIVTLIVPDGTGNLAALDEQIAQPLVRSIEPLPALDGTPTVAPVTPAPTGTVRVGPVTPTIVPTPTPRPLTVRLQTYPDSGLGLEYPAPAGWTRHVYSRLPGLNDGVRNTFYYTNRSDIGPDVPLPTAPALFLLRVDLMEANLGTTEFDGPVAFLREFGGFEEAAIEEYDGGAFSAARLTEAADAGGDMDVLIYAVMFSPSDWLMISLVAPEGPPLLALDEKLVQPLVGSLAVLDGAAPASSPNRWPTLTPESVG